MYASSSAVRERLGHSRSQIERGAEGRAGATCDDSTCHSFCLSFSALLIKKFAQFFLGKFIHQVGRCRPGTLVHAHVERPHLLKRKSPLRCLQLRRGDTEVQKDSFDFLPTVLVRACFQFSEIPLLPPKLSRPLGLQLPRGLSRGSVLVQPEDLCPRLQQRAGMPTTAKSSIHPSMPGPHMRSREHLP